VPFVFSDNVRDHRSSTKENAGETRATSEGAIPAQAGIVTERANLEKAEPKASAVEDSVDRIVRVIVCLLAGILR
jgi:hypothetical protein